MLYGPFELIAITFFQLLGFVPTERLELKKNNAFVHYGTANQIKSIIEIELSNLAPLALVYSSTCV